MTDTAADVIESVATDGGATVDGRAEGIGRRPAAIYHAIDDFEDILERDDDQVSYRARKYREELRARREHGVPDRELRRPSLRRPEARQVP